MKNNLPQELTDALSDYSKLYMDLGRTVTYEVGIFLKTRGDRIAPPLGKAIEAYGKVVTLTGKHISTLIQLGGDYLVKLSANM